MNQEIGECRFQERSTAADIGEVALLIFNLEIRFRHVCFALDLDSNRAIRNRKETMTENTKKKKKFAVLRPFVVPRLDERVQVLNESRNGNGLQSWMLFLPFQMMVRNI